MARVRVKINGNEPLVTEAKTVSELRALHKIPDTMEPTSRGEPVNDKYELIDGDEVIFAGRVRGGMAY